MSTVHAGVGRTATRRRRAGWIGAHGIAGWTLAMLLLAYAHGAQAHAHLLAAVPADGSTLQKAPRALVLSFSQAARLTALSIAGSGAPARRLGPIAQEPQAKITVPLPHLAPGVYVVRWRAVSADGHVVPGHIHFTLTR